MIDLVWCDGCNQLWTRLDLKADGDSLQCPECGRELPTYRMIIHECPRCHQKILYLPGCESRIVCECEQEKAEIPANKTPEMQETDGEPETASGEADNVPEHEEPDVTNIIWQSGSDEEVAFAPLRGKKIRYGDTLTLEDQQAACFSCGGRLFWAYGPALRKVGFDSREPEEIRLAYQYGENTGLPPMINTSIVIYDLRKRTGLTGESDMPVLLAGRMGFLPTFCFDLVIDNPRKLRPVVFEKEIPGLSDLKEHVIFQLTRKLAERVEDYAAEPETLPEARKAVQEHLEACLAAVVKENQPGSDWGLRTDGVKLTGCRFYLHLCPVCHQPVDSQAAECVNGHPIRWCPVCGEVQNDGICVNGHQFRFCRLCGREILLAGGKCPRHGSLGLDI